MKFADSRRRKNFSKDPAVIKFKDLYYLYYSIPPYNRGLRKLFRRLITLKRDGWGIGIATSQDLENWKIIGEIQSQCTYEKNGFCAPGAFVKEGIIHLFYQTYGNGKQDAICHATSKDGTTFERNPSNPIIKPTGNWNNGRAIDADVIEWGDELFCYWATRDPTGKIQQLGVSSAPIKSQFHRDDWIQRCDAPILFPKLDWEKKCIEAPALCTHDGRLYMFYAGGYNNNPQQIGCAVSDDGIQFERLFEKPLLPNGVPGEWNSSVSGHPFVFEDDNGQQYLFFQGNNTNGKDWFISRKRITWIEGAPKLS